MLEKSAPPGYKRLDPKDRVRTCFGKLCRVMEIDAAIFQDMESFAKEKLFKIAMEKFWAFAWEYSKIS